MSLGPILGVEITKERKRERKERERDKENKEGRKEGRKRKTERERRENVRNWKWGIGSSNREAISNLSKTIPLVQWNENRLGSKEVETVFQELQSSENL